MKRKKAISYAISLGIFGMLFSNNVFAVDSNVPYITSISNSGMRLINVSFSSVVDKTSAEQTSNYIIKNNKTSAVSISSSKLLSDGKTVQLFLNAGMYNDSIEDSIETRNIKSSNQLTTITTTTKTFTMLDSSIPTVVSVESINDKTIAVVFSEPIQNLINTNNSIYSSIKLDDKSLKNIGNITTADTDNSFYVASVIYPYEGDYKKAVINFTRSIPLGTHVITLGGLYVTDYNVTLEGSANFNVMQPMGYIFNVKPATDTIAPTLLSIESLTQTKFRYTFSEPIQMPGNSAFFWSKDINALTITPSNSISKISDVSYEVTWSKPVEAGITYFFAGTVSTSGRIVDVFGNTIHPSPSSKVINVTLDTAPSLVSVSMADNSNRLIKIIFDRDIDPKSVLRSNFVFKDIYGKAFSLPDMSGYSGETINTKGNTVEIILSKDDTTGFSNGSYTVTVSNIKNISGVAMFLSQSYSFSVNTIKATSDSVPMLESISMADNSNRLIKISFDKDIDTSSITASNFIIKDIYNNVINSSKNIAINGKNLEILVGNNDSDGLKNGSYKLSMSNIKALNSLTSMKLEVSISFVVNKATTSIPTSSNAQPILAYAEENSNKTIYVKFDKAIDSIESYIYAFSKPDSTLLESSKYLVFPDGTGKPQGSSYSFKNPNEKTIVKIDLGDMLSMGGSTNSINYGLYNGSFVLIIIDKSTGYIMEGLPFTINNPSNTTKEDIYTNTIDTTTDVIKDISSNQSNTNTAIDNKFLFNIDLRLENKKIFWKTDGYSENGYIIVISENENPTFPESYSIKVPHQNYYYTDMSQFNYGGQGQNKVGVSSLYVRVCELLDSGYCGIYSNQVKFNLQNTVTTNQNSYGDASQQIQVSDNNPQTKSNPIKNQDSQINKNINSEKIPNIESLKYFTNIKRIGNDLYGTRLSSLTFGKEKIPSLDVLRYYKGVEKIGDDLYGIKLVDEAQIKKIKKTNEINSKINLLQSQIEKLRIELSNL